jgi:hypothetical protein
MTKNAVRLILFAVLIPFAFPWEGAASRFTAPVPAEAKGIFAASSYLPALDLNTDDLDVRDAQNRPVRTIAAHAQLAQLFVENLFALTVTAEPHALRQAWSILEALSHLFHNPIFKAIETTFAWLPDTLLPSPRRVVHNVDKLWISFSVGVFCDSGPSASAVLDHTVQRLNLRC